MPKVTASPPPVVVTDVCPNITGNQASVPAGMVQDTNGNCVTPGRGGDVGEVLGITTVATVTPKVTVTTAPELANTGQNSIVNMIVGFTIAGMALATAGLARRQTA